MNVGGKYNWKGQRERLVYIGRNWSGNGYWHQFEKVGEPGVVWCEVVDADLAKFEESEPTLASPLPEAAEPVAEMVVTRVFTEYENSEKEDTVGAPHSFCLMHAASLKLPEGRYQLYAAPSPVAQAPAQAGEVAKLAEDARDWTDSECAAFRQGWALGRKEGLRVATQPLAAPVQQEAEAVAQVTSEMVNRFLSWKLPPDFCPDGGITFKRVYNETSPFGPQNHEPSGTNLLTGDQARAMLEHVLATPPAHPVLAPVVREPLTEAQINRIVSASEVYQYHPGGLIQFVRDIEAELGIQATTRKQS